MHEVLNLSLSQRANHLTTHFYNAQESYLDYSVSSTESPNDTNVYFKPTLAANNTINFNPRALIWDLNGGFGSLGQFEYVSKGEVSEDSSPAQFQTSIISKPRIPKAQYQKSLDNGEVLPKLDKSNTHYWSDYSRVIYEPKSFNVLSKWEFDPIEYPRGRLSFGQEREFMGYDLGLEEWKDLGIEFLENKYRIMLEECDLINGINLVTEIDSAWGGFGSGLLNELRDDYNPKSSIFQWGLFNNKSISQLSNKEILSRIKTFLELSKNSSLFIPLGLPKFRQFDQENMWESSSLQNLVFETVQVLNSQRENRSTFHQFESALTIGDKRNLITKVAATIGSETIEFSQNFFKPFYPRKPQKVQSDYTFSKSIIKRPSQSSVSLADLSVSASTHDRTTSEYKTSLSFPTPDSYPQDIISSSDSLNVTLDIDSSARRLLLDMKSFVSKFVKGDERSDIIDELSELAAEYEHGWNDSDESDDDY
ncbi:hypothetical protein WICMUC_005682 [Wickerhamomyces mucosus]|uniref:Protein DML1 n=1 Tax=Wickerhamomyces mucosus TaxID=1378264 RepID=A0A9P8P7J4_9ASCO|nr:hypothetical protein WICMUC_005682 [Wickerhamomyces mucosus]